MGGDKDLEIDYKHQQGPLVMPCSDFDDMMYLEMARIKGQLKAIREILKDVS